MNVAFSKILFGKIKELQKRGEVPEKSGT